jgi:dTDP-4-dehydrorhamnose 3,5-epimerase
VKETIVQVSPAEIPAIRVIDPRVFGDERGFFLETWSSRRYAEAGLPAGFVQDNLSRSARGVVRGLHLQHPNGQGKLVYVLEGEVFDVAVDVRVGSPTFGRWVGFVLSAKNKRQLYIPPGFAHGFCVTSEFALFAYKCTEIYRPDTEIGVLWSDPAIGIAWPVGNPVLSDKDRAYPTLAEIPKTRLPSYEVPT